MLRLPYGRGGIIPIGAHCPVPGSGFATWDPGASSLGSGMDLSGGNLIATNNSLSNAFVSATGIHNSGKYYLEITWTGASLNSVSSTTWLAGLKRESGSFPGNYVVGAPVNSGWQVAGSIIGTLCGYIASTGQVMGIAMDFDNNLIWNMSDQDTRWNINGSATPVSSSPDVGGVGGADISPALGVGSGWIFLINDGDNVGQIATLNTGQSAYHFTRPAGFNNW